MNLRRESADMAMLLVVLAGKVGGRIAGITAQRRGNVQQVRQTTGEGLRAGLRLGRRAGARERLRLGLIGPTPNLARSLNPLPNRNRSRSLSLAVCAARVLVVLERTEHFPQQLQRQADDVGLAAGEDVDPVEAVLVAKGAGFA